MTKQKQPATGLSEYRSCGLSFIRHLSFVIRSPRQSAATAGHSRLCLLAILLGLCGWCGCQTTPKNLFAATGPGWRVQQGQALWRPQRGLPEFGGDLVLASDDAGRHLIQFDKTPIAILSAQTTSNRWQIDFPRRHQGFSGRGYGWRASHFGWLFLPAALDGKTLPGNFHFERKPDGGWRLENSRTGETLEGFLSP